MAEAPCVLRYRLYCDKIREQAGNIPIDPLAVHIKAFLPMAESWSKKKKAACLGKRQRLKPDWDNIGKGICDALFDEDSCIAVGICEKFWCNIGRRANRSDRDLRRVRSKAIWNWT
jgi:Holliday junction resolvase RusA-like endonuclease